MKNIIVTGMIVISILTIFSCKKNDDTTPAKASLTITAPVLNQEYRLGDTVRISGIASHVTNLHGYHACILNTSGDTLFQADNHSHAMQLSINEKWTNTLSTAQTLKVLVSSPIDHDGNELKKEVTIQVIP